MAYETFELRFKDCDHTRRIPLLHNQNDADCFVCRPELRDVPAAGKCPDCMSAAQTGVDPKAVHIGFEQEFDE